MLFWKGVDNLIRRGKYTFLNLLFLYISVDLPLTQLFTKCNEIKIMFDMFQSDTFAEGERAESPGIVGEKLSREASPVPGEGEKLVEQPEPIEPGTPERSRPGTILSYSVSVPGEGEKLVEQPEPIEPGTPDRSRPGRILSYSVSLSFSHFQQLQIYSMEIETYLVRMMYSW